MGSPLSPVITNFFMEDFEERALVQATHKLLCWFCYADDTFVIWLHRTKKLERLLNHLNGLLRNIHFTTERERQTATHQFSTSTYTRD